MAHRNSFRFPVVFVVVFAFVWALQPHYAFAQSAERSFARANETYKNADYKRAAQMYEDLVKEGIEAEEVYFNLGNCYYKLGNMSAAILNYERAQRLAPTDEDIDFNLELAKSRITDKIDPAPQFFIIKWWRMFVALATPSAWSLVGVVFVWLFCIAAALFFIARSPTVKKTFFVLGIVTLICATLMFTFAFQQQHKAVSAIVFASSVVIKSEPQEVSKDLFVLHEGTKVDVLGTDGEWCKVRIADGSVGWMRINTIRVI
ncbi:MAG: tetratricopeptide repeat protein [Candidatus Kapabacteria bacterium]|nr:tetratricopeptide repeat protein [Candidatus Kapabacteria bacterium]